MQRSFAEVPLLPENSCVFLDFDGTLVDFASTPAAIAVPLELVPLLDALRSRLDGALALVTGRPLTDLDHYLAPLRLPAAALHGTLRRDAAGQLHGHRDTGAADFTARTGALRERLRRWSATHAGLLLEDKGLAMAVHFRAMPRAAPELLELQQELHRELTTQLPDGMELLSGDLVVEVRPRGSDKGSAVAAFLTESPFRGRFPVYLGDDLADLQGMAAVERHGGLAIAVGQRIPARWHLPTPAAARDWLAACLNAQQWP